MLFKLFAFVLLASWSSHVGVGVPISSKVFYEDDQWKGTIGCQFSDVSGCSLSFHTAGRRIDVDNHLEKENVFVSCVSSDTSIALSISNFTYDDVLDYTCLEEVTQQNHKAWIVPSPDLKVQGIVMEGMEVRLMCSSVYGAPLFWVLPGDSSNNADVTIDTYVSDVNASTSATFRLESSDNYAEYKCCIKPKSNQLTDIPCSGYTFLLDGSVEVLSTYENYKDTNALTMQCVFRSDPVADTSLIQWKECSTPQSCSDVYYSYVSNVVNDEQFTVASTLTISYYGSGYYYVCSYENVSHTFNVDTQLYAPQVVAMDKEIFYSTEGYAVTLGCTVTANPPPEITWAKTAFNGYSDGWHVVETTGNYIVTTSQTADDQWETVLIIYPYDVNSDNANFSCSAANDLGEKTLQMDTNNGPNNVDLEIEAGINSTDVNVRGICSFQMFPYPPVYEMTVLCAEDISYNTLITEDEELSQVTAEVIFDVLSSSYYPITVQCSALNRFHPESQVISSMVINAANFTTTTIETTTTTTTAASTVSAALP